MKNPNNQKVQDLLSQYRLMCSMINKLELQREEIMTLATKVTTNLSPEPGGGGDSSRKVENWAMKLSELDEKIDEQINIFSDVADEVMTLISLMPECTEKGIIYDRYITGLTFDKLARKNGYSESHTFLLHRRGIETLAKILAES